MTLDRRAFLSAAAAVPAAALFPAPAVLGQARARIVVVGGGPGGATAAKYAARDGAGALSVVLVEPADRYVTCFHSNLVLGGMKSMASITHGYDALVSRYGVQHARNTATAVDRERREVRLDDGSRLPYDRLVLSPGIDLDYASVPGWGRDAEETMPHAWKAGRQTQILIDRLAAVPDGGVIVMLAPPNPYRCPPGPYERVSMMAHLLKSTGRGNCKIMVIDPKESFSKQGLFQEGWETHYPGMIEWLGPKIHEGVKSVDPKSNTVVTGFETYKDAALVNVIPAQMAGAIARDAGLANATRFCPIDPQTMRSTLDPNIYVLGDSCIAGDMPKSGFAANNQAKVAAMNLRAELTGSRAFPARYANTCWSLIAPDDAVKVGGSYTARDGKIAALETFVSQPDETPDMRKSQQSENLGWYDGITADIFG